MIRNPNDSCICILTSYFSAMNGKVNAFIRSEYRNIFTQGIRNYAGHSKWQNIKNIKMQNDTARAQVFKTLSSKMRVSVTETGDPDPTTNSKLAALIEQARKNNMPSSTLNNILEKLKDQKYDDPMYSLIVRNDTGAILILYIKYQNTVHVRNILAQITKKFNSKIADSTLLSTFDCASYITAFKDCNIDQAMEDAIQTDADDVQQIQIGDETYFQFKTKYLQPEKTITQLTNLGYTIESSDNKCIPQTTVELNETELEIINKLKAKLMADIPGVAKIEDNIAS